MKDLNSEGKILTQQIKTRRLSVAEGAAASITSGAGEAYISPYAIELGANNFQIGLLSSLAGFLGPIAQLIGSRLIEKFSRRKIIFYSVLIQASIWFLFCLLGLTFLFKGQSPYLIPAFIGIFILYSFAGSFGGPAWFSMLGESVPANIRGQYFSKRNRWSGIFNIVATTLAALILYLAQSGTWLIFGFILLFVISAITRYISATLINFHYDPPLKPAPDYYFSFWQFIRRAPQNNFGRFVFYIATINLAVNLANPFFAVYLWKDLAFNPIWFTAINISAGIFSFLFLPFWGRLADQYGNRELLRLGSLLVMPVPLLWLVSGSPLYLILVPQLLQGIGWSAFALAASNFIYDSVTPERRALCVAYQNVLNGVGVLIGASLGGLLAGISLGVEFSPWLLVFSLSVLARLIVHYLIFPNFKEVRQDTKQHHHNPLLYLIEFSNFPFLFREWETTVDNKTIFFWHRLKQRWYNKNNGTREPKQ